MSVGWLKWWNQVDSKPAKRYGEAIPLVAAEVALIQGQEVEMGLVAVDVETDHRSALHFETIQLDQFKHDETYHREIARLSTQDRLKHMALHFAKYAGNLAEPTSDEIALKKAVTDTFIIAVSTANTLNVRVSEYIDC